MEASLCRSFRLKSYTKLGANAHKLYQLTHLHGRTANTAPSLTPPQTAPPTPAESTPSLHRG